MAENLFPVEEELLTEDEERTEDALYIDGLAFENDLSLDGKNNVIPCSPVESWAIWCRKALETPRNQCDCYSEDYGIDIESVFSSKTREEAESILESEIENTLLNADQYNRTVYIEGITFEWVGSDSVIVHVYLVGHEGFATTIDATISG